MASRTASAMSSTEPPNTFIRVDGGSWVTCRPAAWSLATTAPIESGTSAISTSSTATPSTLPISSSRRPCATRATGVERDDVVADPFDFPQQVGGEQDVDPVVGADLFDEREHFVTLHGVEAVGRFVEQYQTGVGRDGLGRA